MGAVDDPLEREADRVADDVLAGTRASIRGLASGAPVQRACAACSAGEGICPKCEEEAQRVQRAPAGASGRPHVGAENRVQRALTAGGKPLPSSTRAFMETRLGHDFSGVRVHTGSAAEDAAAAIEARAFTVGRDIVFGANEFAPEAPGGRHLLAHELTHVVQQRQAAPASGAIVQRQPAPGAAQDEEEPQLTRAEEIALSRTSPGEVAGESQPLALSLYNFAIDADTPKAEHLAIVAELGRFLHTMASTATVVRVIGFADATGSERHNLALSRRRAEAVKAILQPLVSHHIALSARGEMNPVASNDTVSGRTRNRRVDIRFAVEIPKTPPQPTPNPPGPPAPPGPPTPPGPGPKPPGGGDDPGHHACADFPLLCGIGVPFFAPLVCLVAPEICAALVCVLEPALCVPPLPPGPPPPPGEPPDKPRKDPPPGAPHVDFRPAVRAPNTPAGMNDRIGLVDPVNVTAVVTNPPDAAQPITIDVSGAGGKAGEATLNGQPRLAIVGTTSFSVQGTGMSAEGFAFSPFLQLGAWWSNDLVGASNRFAVSSIAEDWTAKLDGTDVTRFGYAFFTEMGWRSDSGAYPDLGACRYVERVEVIEEGGGMKGMGVGGVNDPNDADTADLHPAWDQHGTPHEYTKVAGHSRLKQLFTIRDMRSNSSWAPSRQSGFVIERRFERDPGNPRCWRLVVTKQGAAVSVAGFGSDAGGGRAEHTFTKINCDPPPKDPPGKDPPKDPPGQEPPTVPPHVTPDEPPATQPPACDRAELGRRVDQCIENARQGAIDCTLDLLPFSGGWGGVGGGIGYLSCLEDVRQALLECDRKAKEDTHCQDDDSRVAQAAAKSLGGTNPPRRA